MRQAREWVLCICLFVPAAAWAATSEVVELHYRSADEMVAVVQPHLGPGESVSGLDNKLILRLKPENRQNILALIRQLDKRPQQLLVSVRQGGERQVDQSEAGVSGTYSTGRGGIELGDDPRPLSGRVIQHSTQSQSGAEQQVRVMAGQPAAFHVGHLVPVPAGATIGPHGYVRHGGIYYQQVTTGFIVRPRLAGQRVLLEISPQRQSLESDGRIAVQHTTTTIEAEPGEWVDIGAVVEDIHETQHGLTSYGSTEGSSHSRVEVKVELER